MSVPKISICICTRNRADIISRAINSIAGSTYPVFQIIVSDDSTNDETKNLLKDRTDVLYSEGPRKGLGANRNNALKSVSGEYILFMDDDALLGATFFETCLNFIRDKFAGNSRLIVTGMEKNAYGTLIEPRDQDFLGFQKVPYRQDTGLRSIVINSTLFPAELFNYTKFDDQLVYGCDEVDIATQAIVCGFQIAFCKEAINSHYKESTGRDYYSPYVSASRLYVTFKKYTFAENRPVKGAFYLVTASAHELAHCLKTMGLPGITKTAKTVDLARTYIKNYRRSLT